MLSVESVMVIGAGQMGSGIAQVHGKAGYQVYLYDVKEEIAKQGMEKVKRDLDRQTKKGKLTKEEREQVLSRMISTTTIKDAVKADIVIEAAVENLDVKVNIFRELDEIAPKETILATNTSSLPITEIAAATHRPEKVIGMHFMNPVPVMRLVEIVRGLVTSDETYETVKKLSKNLEKTPVEVNDFPGFASNRVLMPMINEAIYTVYEGVAEPEAIDKIMKLGMNHPMGPVTLADFIGLDTCLYIMETLHEGFGDDKYRSCPLLRQYVKAGRLGRKTGQGFYKYL